MKTKIEKYIYELDALTRQKVGVQIKGNVSLSFSLSLSLSDEYNRVF